MKFILNKIILFCLVQFFLIGYCDNGFVTIWAPTHLSRGIPLSFTLLGSNFQNEIKAVINFRNSSTNIDFKCEEFVTENIKNDRPLNENRKYSATILFYHLDSVTSDKLCSTKHVELTPEPRNFYIFIQTDKPIYKPGDVVNFRILVIDKKMRPMQMNNIKVDFIDPFNRTIKSFENLEDQFVGVFEEYFKLTTSTMLGDWIIHVVVDKKDQFGAEKVFTVQKYVLPLFEVHVSASEKDYLINSDLEISFFAKYSFGEFVNGHADLIIRNPIDNINNTLKQFQNVKDETKFIYNMARDSFFQTNDQLDLEAIVVFREPESGLKFSRSTTFTVHKDESYAIIPIHPSKFNPGSEFTIKIFVNDWRGNPVLDHEDKLQLKWTWTFRNRKKRSSKEPLSVINGASNYSMVIPKFVVNINLEIKFLNSKIYKKDIKRGKDSIATYDLVVEHAPQNPNLDEIVEIYVESISEIDKLLVMISSSSGHLQTQVIQCNNLMFCEFELKITKEMMPHSTITVYHAVKESTILQGFTQIGTENLSENHLNFSISKSHAKTKDKIEMNFSTYERSKIFLLSFDKRLKFLKDGNDINKDDVMTAVNSYNRNIQMLTIEPTSWKKCTDDEIEYLDINPGFDVRFDDDDEEISEDPILRHNFPETWIFESIDVGNSGTAVKEFIVPDSITTWLVSAFSVNRDYGIAIANTQELTVKNDFFVKMNLPYSIRFKEVLRLDILVYNYIENKNVLQADVELLNLNDGNEFQFVVFSKVRGICSSSYNNNLKSTKSVNVPYKGVKKVSFFIRSNTIDNGQSENVPKEIQFIVKATGTDKKRKTYHDLVQKKLLVEPAGVRDYIISVDDYVLDGSEPKNYSMHANFTEELGGIDVIFGGDYLSDSINLKGRFKLFPTDCLEQQTSKLKGNVEYYRYLLTKEKNPSKEHFSKYYQKLLVQRTKSWNYKTKSGYRAYFLEAIASAMEIGALPMNKKIIKKELDALKKKQDRSGKFIDFGTFPKFKENSYIETAFVLIPFLKLRQFDGISYDVVIRKAFSFLDSDQNRNDDSKESLSVAAYAYSLNGDDVKALNLLDKLEDVSINYPNNRKCFKNRQRDKKCDLRITAYAALAYLSVNEISIASKLVNWMIKDRNLNFHSSNTHIYAIATEPIAKIVKILKPSATNFKFQLSNGEQFIKTGNIKVKNHTLHIPFPAYSQHVISSVEGHGYCSITTFVERIVSLRKVSPSFKVTAQLARESNINNRLIVEVCAIYEIRISIPLLNVIYEVELPSGYVFEEILNLNSKPEIKLVESRRKGSLVQIYYNDFEYKKKYCVKIKGRKVFEVEDVKPAGVKVYDYNDKQNVAIEFYSPVKPKC